MRPSGLRWAVLGLALFPAALEAQGAGPDLTVAGAQAYQNLEFDRAATLLTRALVDTASGLSHVQRARALSYLAAANLFGGHRDRAAAACRQLVELDPSIRPDSLVFPPAVLAVYDEARRATPVVGIEVPMRQVVRPAESVPMVRLFATVPQTVDVSLRRADGTVRTSLYSGPIADSLHVPWNGRDARGQVPDDSTLWLRVASRAYAGGPETRVVVVPLHLRVQSPDTLAWPLFSQDSLLPERSAGGARLGPLLVGSLLSGATMALPELISGRADGTPGRYVVAAALGVTGVVGLLAARRGRVLPANIQANAVRRRAWQDAVAAVRAANGRRRAEAAISIEAGAQTTVPPESP